MKERNGCIHSLLVGAGVAALAFALYAFTACPTVYVGDAPEIALAAVAWGIPHPPGYPLQTLLSGMFVRLLPFGELAWRANLFSAFAAAVAVGELFLLARRFGAGPLAALAAAGALAFGATFWSQAVTAEVYALDLALFLGGWLAVLRAREQPSARRMLLAGILLGLHCGHRPTNVLLLPAFLALLESGRRQARAPLGRWLAAVAGALATGLVYLWLPLRSRANPALDIGDPESLGQFWQVVSAQTYRRHLFGGDTGHNLGRIGRLLVSLPWDVGAAALLAPLGLWAQRRAPQRGTWRALLWMLALSAGFSAFYNILDITPYWLPTHALCALASVWGLAVLPPRLTLGALLAACALIPLNFAGNDLRALRIADQHARDVLDGVEPGALLITSGDTSAHALMYLQSAEGLRPDVTLVRGAVPDWGARQLMQRHPEVDWPPLAEVDAGTWLDSLLLRNLGKRAIYQLEPAELRIPHLLAQIRDVPEGARFRLRPAGQPPAGDELASARAFWARARPPGAAELRDADVQVLMTAYSYTVARFWFAAALLRAGDADRGASELTALVQAAPDTLAARIGAAYATMGRGIPQLGIGARARQALAARAGGPAAMFAALAGG